MQYRTNSAYIDELNRHQKSWKAVQYPQFQGMLLEDVISMSGGRKSKIIR